MNATTPKNLSIIIPVFNEAKIILTFHQNLQEVIDQTRDMINNLEILYINDGSTDDTAKTLKSLCEVDKHVKILSLSRNFGHQSALTCGLDHANGDVIIMMDGDGQNPPALIPEMLSLYQLGYDIVIGQRLDDSSDSILKNFSSKLFYKIINLIGNLDITPNAADFRLITRQVVESLKSMPEYHRFIRGMISWVGFKSVILPFKPHPRLGGQSKYSFKKMIQLAGDAIFSFSLVPLKIGLAIGGLFYLLALVEVFYVLSLWFTGNQERLEPGWSSLMFMLLIVGGTITMVVSFIGIYVGYIFQEVKNRPVYLLKNRQHNYMED
jgi:polyisoprenyl-phosphate glycosyltransferase